MVETSYNLAYQKISSSENQRQKSPVNLRHMQHYNMPGSAMG